MNYLIAAYICVGTFYGLRLAKRYAHGASDMAFIVGLSAVMWPLLMMNEAGE